MNKEILIIRHARSLRAKHDIYGRRYNAPIDKQHIHMVEEAKDYANKVNFNTFISSPARRCVQTLNYISSQNGDFQLIEEFKPYYSGDMEELRDSYVKNQFPQYYQSSFSEKFLNPKFGEESLGEQVQRVCPGVVKLLAFAESEPVVLCTHYSVIQIICNTLNLEHDLSKIGRGNFDLGEGAYLHLNLASSGVNVIATNGNIRKLPL